MKTIRPTNSVWNISEKKYVPNTKERVYRAYCEGGFARSKKQENPHSKEYKLYAKNRNENPYIVGTVEYDAWDKGWECNDMSW